MILLIYETLKPVKAVEVFLFRGCSSVVERRRLNRGSMVRTHSPPQRAADVPQVTCKSLSLAYWRQAHEYLCVLRGHFKKIMNENEIQFCYIANRQHGTAKITQNQYNQILNILYGKEKV